MIDIIGKNIIQAALLDEEADEVTSSNDKILSICMRYLDEFQNTREIFIEFLNLERISGEHIGEAF